MVTGKWFITPHAVHRYIARSHPKLSYDEALAELIRVSEKAKRKKSLGDGIAMYRGPKPEKLRCIVSENITEENPLPQLLTVYTYNDPWFGKEKEDEFNENREN